MGTFIGALAQQLIPPAPVYFTSINIQLTKMNPLALIYQFQGLVICTYCSLKH